MSAILEQPKLVYPESDGKPMAETSLHVQAILLLFQALQDHFRGRSDVFIAADMLWYFEEGRTIGVAPDVMVVPGVGNHHRRSFFTWRENGAVPAVVFEVASRGTWREDTREKFDLYEARGVREYFVFDPEGKYILPRLRGFRLGRKGYRPIRSSKRSLASRLGFNVRAEGDMLRLIDRETGLPMPTRSERADALASEVERLKALLASQGTPS